MARNWVDVVKDGPEPHLQDATPLTIGQEWSGYATQLNDALGPLSGKPSRGCFDWPSEAPL